MSERNRTATRRPPDDGVLPVTIGIDAGVVAAHQVAIRGAGVTENFRVMPTLAGMATLTERLRPYAGSMAIAEPTAGTWMPLSVAVRDAGCRIGFVPNRDSARLRKAITGATKTDLIDAEMLTQCEQVLGITEAVPVSAGQVALRRAMHRRHIATVNAHRSECRLWALAAWAFPDVWRACGGHGIAQPILEQWPHLGSLSRAHLDSITGIVADHSRDKEPHRRAARIREGAHGWRRFWAGHLDLDTLAWEVQELLDDVRLADLAQTSATRQALALRKVYWSDDILETITGIGPICAAATRAWWGDGAHFHSAKAAAAFVGLNPSNWESGMSASPSRPITKMACGGADQNRLFPSEEVDDDGDGWPGYSSGSADVRLRGFGHGRGERGSCHARRSCTFADVVGAVQRSRRRGLRSRGMHGLAVCGRGAGAGRCRGAPGRAGGDGRVAGQEAAGEDRSG